jgi:hypothetical protein
MGEQINNRRIPTGPEMMLAVRASVAPCNGQARGAKASSSSRGAHGLLGLARAQWFRRFGAGKVARRGLTATRPLINDVASSVAEDEKAMPRARSHSISDAPARRFQLAQVDISFALSEQAPALVKQAGGSAHPALVSACCERTPGPYG